MTTTMMLHDYQSGEAIRPLTEAESAAYMASIANDNTETGAVSGEPYGYTGTVYAV